MKLLTLFSAIALPALALASEGGEEPTSTTTCTSTTTLTKTLTLTNQHTATANISASAEPTGTDSAGLPDPTEDSDAAVSEPPTAGAAALDVAQYAFAGVAGMVVVAFL